MGQSWPGKCNESVMPLLCRSAAGGESRDATGGCPLAASFAASIVGPMTEMPEPKLRRGWTTGACATAAVKAALGQLWGGAFLDPVTITLPRGETPVFALAHKATGAGWAEAGIIKDAGAASNVDIGHVGAMNQQELRDCIKAWLPT